MSIAPSQSHAAIGPPTDVDSSSEKLRTGLRPIFDLAGIDLSRRVHSKSDIERQNPHRDLMSLLDAIVWTTDDFKRGVAIKHIRKDEFWIPGHFPEKAIFPGVLMIEAGAQLACFLYNIRKAHPKLVAFARIENASFRNAVFPGDDLYLLCSEVKFGSRRFVSDIQGVVNDKIAFEARISGLEL